MGIDLSNEIQEMFDIIMKVKDIEIREQLQIQLANINESVNRKSKIIIDIHKKLNEL